MGLGINWIFIGGFCTGVFTMIVIGLYSVRYPLWCLYMQKMQYQDAITLNNELLDKHEQKVRKYKMRFEL